MAFALLFLIPALVAIAFFAITKTTITLKEFILQMALQAVIAGVSVAVIYNRNTWDYETFNGTVVSKEKDRVSCDHSYDCFCYESCSGSGENQTCHQVCQTCYEHSYDYSWRVHSDIGSLTINRIDRQGVNEPPRWTAVKIGEPFSDSRSFVNYIKAAPDTLFRHQGLVEKYQNQLPAYPGQVYDYYRMNRVVTVGGQVANLTQWNQSLSDINRDIGNTTKVNMILVLAYNQPREYFYALEQYWIGGKKNDAILVVGLNSQNEIQWSEVMSWTTNELFKVSLKNRVLEQKVLDQTLILGALKEESAKGFIRRNMKDFEYLQASITPSTTEWIVSIIIGMMVSVGLGLYMHKNDVFSEEWSRNRFRY